MKKQLEQYFGCDVKVTEYENKLQLPIFMTMRNIKLIELGGIKFALVLELLYMDDDKSALKSEIARKLNLTKTSITRATVQLEEMALIIQRKSGTGISIKRNYPGREYYEKAKTYLINPIQKVITVMGIESTWKMWYAGESAPSQISGLNPPRIEEMAIYKGDEIVDQFDIVDERFADNELFAKVQLWLNLCV